MTWNLTNCKSSCVHFFCCSCFFQRLYFRFKQAEVIIIVCIYLLIYVLCCKKEDRRKVFTINPLENTSGSVHFQLALGQLFPFIHLKKGAAILNWYSFLFSMNTLGNYPVLKSMSTCKCLAFLLNRECWSSSKSLVGWNLFLQGEGNSVAFWFRENYVMLKRST